MTVFLEGGRVDGLPCIRRSPLEALDNAQATLQLHGADISTVTSTFFTEFAALDFGGDD